ncbi:MAG: hypothetical protein Q9226_005254 [Calogaya cf. arnoldii]
MKYFTIIIGTAALAIHGVAGAALPAKAIKPNAPATAMHDKEILKRVEDCGPRGACGMGSYGVWCCPFPPGKSTAYPRSEKNAAVEPNANGPSTAMHDNEILERAMGPDMK